jgi:hypothetical protein
MPDSTASEVENLALAKISNKNQTALLEEMSLNDMSGGAPPM